jgi:hypothetical protein
MSKKHLQLSERWITFFKIILDPWIILSMTFLVLLVVVSKHADNVPLRIILTTLVAILSMIIGSVFIRRWMEFHDEKNMILRGKLDIRHLKLIYFNLIQIETRTEKYIKRMDENVSNPELVKSNYEEIIEKCKLLEEECINAIENWTDIIEEANVKTRISKLKFLKAENDKLQIEISDLEKQMTEGGITSGEIMSKIKDQLEQKKLDLKEIRILIWEKEKEINASILSGMTGSYLPKDTIYSIYKSCPICGSFYSGSYICPFCSEPSTKGAINLT